MASRTSGGALSPRMTKKRAIEIATSPAEFPLSQLERARVRLGEALETGTPGGFFEHMYVQDRVKDLDRAISMRAAAQREESSS